MTYNISLIIAVNFLFCLTVKTLLTINKLVVKLKIIKAYDLQTWIHMHKVNVDIM